MTKADGSLVTVTFDKNLTVTKVESGMGAGDSRPARRAPPGPAGHRRPASAPGGRASGRTQGRGAAARGTVLTPFADAAPPEPSEPPVGRA